MRVGLSVLLAATGIAAAQQSDFISPQSEAWFHISFEDRVQLFEDEARDADWAASMLIRARPETATGQL